MQKEIQIRYHTHREARNEQQRTKLLASDFSGFMIDPVLEKLIDSDANPGYIDPRNCLVFWVRPPKRIRGFVGIIQAQLLELAPSQYARDFEGILTH